MFFSVLRIKNFQEKDHPQEPKAQCGDAPCYSSPPSSLPSSPLTAPVDSAIPFMKLLSSVWYSEECALFSTSCGVFLYITLLATVPGVDSKALLTHEAYLT
jgi:hypothetical protein